jgi:N-acetylmuramoyl-L-alanine amidase
VRRVPAAAAAIIIVLVAAGCSSGTAGQVRTNSAQARTSETTRMLVNGASADASPTVHPSTPNSSPSSDLPTTHPAAHRSTTTAPALPTPPVHGLTVVLNPGHDGGDASHTAEINRQVPAGYGMYKACDTTGTDTNAGYPEHAFNWDVALRAAALLRARGVNVIMTRPNDSGVGPCVDERAAIGNRAGVAAVVSIHADGAPSAGHGFHVNQDSRRPDGATAATAQRSIALGKAIHAALVRSSGLVPSTYIGQDGYYYRSDLAGLNLATNPATFLELGNMKNAGDAALQSSASGRQQIATAIAAGILAFLGR